jgi:hypothetical protein
MNDLGVPKGDPMVSRTGIEPVTCRLGGGRSILLSYRDVSEMTLSMDRRLTRLLPLVPDSVSGTLTP